MTNTEWDEFHRNQRLYKQNRKYIGDNYKVEPSLSTNPKGTHGYRWDKKKAADRARNPRKNPTGDPNVNPQGRFGSKADGTSRPATHIFIEVKPGEVIRTFPVDANYNITQRTGF